MPPAPTSLWIACAVSGAAWALAAAWRSGARTSDLAGRALLGGVAAFFVASAGYDLAASAGVPVTWELIQPLDGRAVLLSALIGVVEEGAKLAGLLLVVERGWRRRAVACAAMGVCAAFAAAEAALVLHGAALAPQLGLRLALAPVAHAILFAPLVIAVAAGARRGGRAWLWVGPALAASAALHGAGDLALALPRFGSVGYAAALLAPVLALHAALHAPRRSAPGPRAVTA